VAASDARTEVLARVRAALLTGRIAVEPPPPPLDHAFERADRGEWRARFVAELRLLNVVVHEERDAAAVRARVASLVEGKSVLAWPARALPYELGATLAEVAARRATPLVDGAAPRDAQAACEVGVTGVDAAIAETGTLALVSSADHPRTASLLPPVHVAVVRDEQLVPSLRAAFRRLGSAIPAASAVNLVTGPSRTADVELQLTLGVHGPGEVVVVLGP
jgi:L-lactate dehydrogenase complex protein LldG